MLPRFLISDCSDLSVLQELPMAINIEMHANSGFTKPVAKTDLAHKTNITNCIILHTVIF